MKVLHQFDPMAIPAPFDNAAYDLVDHIVRGHEKRVQRAMRRMQRTIGGQIMGDFGFELNAFYVCPCHYHFIQMTHSIPKIESIYTIKS